VIAVADDERKRRAERPSVPKTGQHLDLIMLELLPRAAAIALLAPAQVGIYRVVVEDKACGKPAEDRDQCGTVRLPCRCEAQH
jgi:hypothetical protein